MGKYFGTDGFRGEAAVKLKTRHAYKIGRFIGWYFGRSHRGRIIIGKDTRLSGDMFEGALSAGILESGADVYRMGITTTPSVSYAVRSGGFDCGVMISASHNMYYDNGIKLINSNGGKMDAQIENQIEEYIDSDSDVIPCAVKMNIGKIVDYSSAKEEYIAHIASAVSCEFKNMRIGIDCANGSAFELAPKLFNRLGIFATIINNHPDGININNNCGSTALNTLRNYVLENNLDAGFAFDGDADRCLAVDENGNNLDGDVILFICGKYLKESGRLKEDTIVTTVMSNIGLYKACKKEGIKIQTTDVGDKYISQAIESGNYSLGGEQSGHTIFGEFAATGDGMLTAAMVLEAMANKKMTLGSLASEVELFPQLTENIKVNDKNTVLSNEKVKKAIFEASESLGENGRIHIRASGTEPVIRVMAEAKSDDTCAFYVHNIINTIISEKLGERQ